MNVMLMASRNLLRNFRRSAVTITAVAAGYAAVCLFGGYIANVYSGLKDQAVRGERLGHLTIYKQGMLQEGRLKPRKYLFSADETRRVAEVVKGYDGVRLLTPRLPISGILSQGTSSTIFIGEGMVADDVTTLRGDLPGDYGGRLYPTKPQGIAMSAEMARLLNLKRGDEATLITSTFSGQANAMDGEIVDIFNTGNAGTNDKTVLVPFSYAQRLMDTEGVERFVVLLDSSDKTDAAQAELTRRLQAAGMHVEIKNWRELSSFYLQVRSLFDMIFTFIFSIVFIVIIMSVVNTMNMIVVERTREIGTLRALGLGRSGVVALFTVEGALLALVGAAIGLSVSVLVAWGVNTAGLSYTPPNSSSAVPLMVDLDHTQMALVFLLATLLAAVAAAWPAAGASRREIHAALTYA